MSPAGPLATYEPEGLSSVRALANQAFSRAAGAPLIARNTVRLLKDAGENYPAWLDAIRAAQRHIHFEFGNCEMDVVVEDESFAQSMEAMFLADLDNASEIVLDDSQKVRAPHQPRHPHSVLHRGGGSSGRAAAGAVRIANVVGAAFTHRRVIEPAEIRITLWAGALLLSLAILFAVFPRFIAYPVALLFAWIATTLLLQAYALHGSRLQRRAERKTGP
jgi:hypothetical protein